MRQDISQMPAASFGHYALLSLAVFGIRSRLESRSHRNYFRRAQMSALLTQQRLSKFEISYSMPYADLLATGFFDFFSSF
jgi:hypothetical protein